MAPETFRIIVSILLFIALHLLFMFALWIFPTFWRIRGQELYLYTALSSCAILFVGWMGIWRRSVYWSASRRLGTLIATIVCIAMAFAVTFFIDQSTARWAGAGSMFGAIVWAYTWVPATLIIWRDRASDLGIKNGDIGSISPRCVNCGYNLTGLREARCPECGTQYTLDVLLTTMLQRTLGPFRNPKNHQSRRSQPIRDREGAVSSRRRLGTDGARLNNGCPAIVLFDPFLRIVAGRFS